MYFILQDFHLLVSLWRAGCTLVEGQKDATCLGGKMKETMQLGEENQVVQWHSLLITILCAMLLSRALHHNLASPDGFQEQHPAPTSPDTVTKVSR